MKAGVCEVVQLLSQLAVVYDYAHIVGFPMEAVKRGSRSSCVRLQSVIDDLRRAGRLMPSQVVGKDEVSRCGAAHWRRRRGMLSRVQVHGMTGVQTRLGRLGSLLILQLRFEQGVHA
jgi:hypothetical protein